jgi:signal transduction histidine kinase
VNAQIQVVLIAAGCTSGVGLTGMGVIWLLRRAALRLLLQVSGAVIVLAVVAGTLGTAQAMFLSPHDLRVVMMVCVVAAVVAAGFGALLGRQLQASSLALRQAARSLGDPGGGYRSPAGPMTAELAALSRELAETSEKLIQSRGREHALERSRRELVSWVSHDLRTPLAGLHAMAEALEDGIAAEPARYHRQIRAEVARLARMVDDLFELSCTQAGTLRLSPGTAGTPLEVRADPREMSRVLTNLLVNAIRHTPQDGSVHVVAAPEPGGALLAVADSCGGIPEADLACAVNTEAGCRFEVRLPALAGPGAYAPSPGGSRTLHCGLQILLSTILSHGGGGTGRPARRGGRPGRGRSLPRALPLAGPDRCAPARQRRGGGGSSPGRLRRRGLRVAAAAGQRRGPALPAPGRHHPGALPWRGVAWPARPAMRPAPARPHGRRPRGRASGPSRPPARGAGPQVLRGLA